jgi:hypothetical protein
VDGFASAAIADLLAAARAIGDDQRIRGGSAHGGQRRMFPTRFRPSGHVLPPRPSSLPARRPVSEGIGQEPRRVDGFASAAIADLLAAARFIGDDQRIRGGSAHRGQRRDRASPTQSRHSRRGPSASRPSSLPGRRPVSEEIGQEPRHVDGFASAAIADLLAAARAIRDDQRIRGGSAHGGQERKLGHLQ